MCFRVPLLSSLHHMGKNIFKNGMMFVYQDASTMSHIFQATLVTPYESWPKSKGNSFGGIVEAILIQKEG